MTEESPSKQTPNLVFLKKPCLQKALEKAYDTSNIKLEDFQWKLVNMKGISYCSNLYRINGSFKKLPSPEKQTFNFFVKDMDMETIENGTNEPLMLNEILPAIMAILEETQMDEMLKSSNKLAANCFLTECNKEQEFYILEDLNVLGFELGNRYEGLSLQAAELVIEKIAKFHAASMVYAEKHPEMIAKLHPSSFAADTPAESISKALIERHMESALKILEKTDQELVQKIKTFLTTFEDKLKNAVDTAKSAFNVLNHGDLWINNILVKGQQFEEDVIFVDYQHASWGSPACDLYYFLFTSLSLADFETQRSKLLEHYYKTLKSLLELMNYENIPTWSDLQADLKAGALIGYYVAVCEFPFTQMSEEVAENFTVKDYIESETTWISIYRNPRVSEFIRYAMLYFDVIGLFDE